MAPNCPEFRSVFRHQCLKTPDTPLIGVDRCRLGAVRVPLFFAAELASRAGPARRCRRIAPDDRANDWDGRLPVPRPFGLRRPQRYGEDGTFRPQPTLAIVDRIGQIHQSAPTALKLAEQRVRKLTGLDSIQPR
jgi:hypothetical protein